MKLTATIFARNENEKDIVVHFTTNQDTAKANILEAKKAIEAAGITLEKGHFVDITGGRYNDPLFSFKIK